MIAINLEKKIFYKLFYKLLSKFMMLADGYDTFWYIYSQGKLIELAAKTLFGMKTVPSVNYMVSM